MQRGRSTLELRAWEIGTHTFHLFKEDHIVLRAMRAKQKYVIKSWSTNMEASTTTTKKKAATLIRIKWRRTSGALARNSYLLLLSSALCVQILSFHTQGVITVTWLWGSRWATDLFLRTSTWGRQMVWMKWLNSWQAFGMGTPPRGRHSKVLVFHRMLLCWAQTGEWTRCCCVNPSSISGTLSPISECCGITGDVFSRHSSQIGVTVEKVLSLLVRQMYSL